MNNNSYLHLLSDILQPILNDKIFFQITNSLSQIILLILLFSWIIKKFFYFRFHQKNILLKIRDKISVGPHESIVVLEVKDIKLVLGITEKNISYLYTLSPYLKNSVYDKKEKMNNKKEKVNDNVE